MTKKYLFLLIFLHSCAVVEYKDVPLLAKSIILGAPDREVTLSLYKSMPYSFAKVKIGRSRVDFMVLLSINNNIYEWIGENDERIYTKFGKVIHTSGLDYNTSIINSSDIKINCNACISNYYIQLENPPALLSQTTKNTLLKNENISFLTETSTTSIVEKFQTIKFKWQGKNIYWFNDVDRPIKTIQKIHPNLGEVEITFYYK